MDDEAYKNNLDGFDAQPKQFIVFCGMPKTGTTLPVTLLDGHSSVVVYPEELRFFHSRCDELPAREAAHQFLSNLNTQMLNSKDAYFDPDDYMSHGGTGFGRRDYSKFDFDLFATRTSGYFLAAKDARQRFLGICLAFLEAMGKTPTENLVFACKAPRNEIYSERWHRILGDEGRYVITTRLPTEHFVSLSNIARFQNKNSLSPALFVSDVLRTFKSWSGFPENCTQVLDYDALIHDPGMGMELILDLVGKQPETVNATPTKMGVPWSGNSSRGKVEDKVYANPHVAEETLSPEVFGYIEHELNGLYKKMGWKPKGHSSILDRAKITVSGLAFRIRRKLDFMGGAKV